MGASTIDFFASEDQARKSSAFLVVVYVLTVMAICMVFHLLMAWMLFEFSDDKLINTDIILNPKIMLYTIGIPLCVILFGTLFKVKSLACGGSTVAKSVGGREVSPQTRNRLERRLLNVVEEMAISSGVRVPRVFILDNEDGINAFAAGYSSNDAAVAVTAGALKALNRDELQAVVGHEFSHILNGDMRLNIWLIGVLGGILCIAVMGNITMRLGAHLASSPSSRSKEKDNTKVAGLAIILFGVLVWLVGSIGIFFGRIIQSAVSRKRECLADASAIQFTRNPMGLSNALKLIGAASNVGYIANSHASELSHMFFVSGVKSLFATHPPLVVRIKALDPRFDGDYSSAAKTLKQRLSTECLSENNDGNEEQDIHAALLATVLASSSVLSRTGTETVKDLKATAENSQTSPIQMQSDSVSTTEHSIGNTELFLKNNYKWLSPDEIKQLADPVSAESCLYASILSSDTEIRSRQFVEINKRNKSSNNKFTLLVEEWAQLQSDWTCRQKRAVCEIAVGTLRICKKNDKDEIISAVDTLSKADGNLDSFEFALARMIRRRLVPDDSQIIRHVFSEKKLSKEIYTVISALAWFGGRTKDASASAFSEGIAEMFPETVSAENAVQSVLEPDLSTVETAMDRLAYLSPPAKQRLLRACRKVVSNDGEVTETESNILAAIADAVGADGWSVE